MTRPSGRFSDVFAEFIADTMRAFGYLVRDFGFEHSGTTIVSYECSIDFRKAGRVAVSVDCEAGALPWVMLTARYRPRPGRPYREEEAALDFVIDHRCPERRVDEPEGFPAESRDVKRLLREYAAALRECAPDFLQGDVSAVLEVREAVKADYSRRLAEDWREERAALAAYRKKMKAAAARKGRKK